MTIGIYCIEHIDSGKKYIGKSKVIEQRFANHRSGLNSDVCNKCTNRKLYNAVKKYGLDRFKFYILESFDHLDDDVLTDSELKWMDHYESCTTKGYNLRRDSRTKCFVHQETRDLLSSMYKGVNNPNYGNRWTPEMKDRMSELQKVKHINGDYIYDQERRDQISERVSNMWKDNPEKKKQMIKNLSIAKRKYNFLQYTRDGQLIKEWDSVKEIVESNPSYKWQNIYSVCNGYKKTYMNYIWKKELKI